MTSAAAPPAADPPTAPRLAGSDGPRFADLVRAEPLIGVALGTRHRLPGRHHRGRAGVGARRPVSLLAAATDLGPWRLLAGPQQAWARVTGDVLVAEPVTWAVAGLVLWTVVPTAVALHRIATVEA